MTAKGRLYAVLTIVLGGALALIASTQTWLTVTLQAGTDEALEVAGADALPLLAPLALAALALGLALTVVGRVLRYVFGVLAAVIGGTILVGALRIALGHPLDAVAPAVTAATGLSGAQAIADLVTAIEGTVWPFAAALGGLLIAAGGVFTLATAHRWRSGGRRYRQSGESGPGRGQTASAGPRPYDSISDRAIDSWDELSHGDDPTAH